MPQKRCAVIGGGIGGLAFAILAARAGWRVDLFEAAPSIRAQGSGFVLQPGGQAVVHALGLWDNVGARANPFGRVVGVDAADGRTAIDVTTRNPALQGYAVERAGLVACLAETAASAGVHLHTGMRTVGVDGRVLRFADGSVSERYDGVVDASGGGGMASPMKAVLLPFGAFWATVPWVEGIASIPHDRLSQRYHGTSKMMGVLPLGQTRTGQEVAAFFWSVRLKDTAAVQADGIDVWKQECLKMWPEVAPFLETLHTWQDVRSSCYSHGRLARPYEPGLVRIGDAAHRTSPQLGQGANMALLDAWALVKALEVSKTWDEASVKAVQARALHVWTYHTASGMFTPQYQSDREGLAWWRNRVLAPLGRVFPAPYVLERLMSGTIVPAIRGLPKPPTGL